MSRSAWGGLLLVCALASSAVAETNQEQAERLFKEGRAALAAKDPTTACNLFTDSIALDPLATGVMLNLGLCNEQLGKFATSLAWFRKAQAAAAEKKLTAYEEAAKDHTLQLSARVSIVTIKYGDVVPGEVRINGRRVDRSDWGRIEVDAGAVTVLASSPEKVDFSTEITIAEAETKTVEIGFQGTVLVDVGKGRRRKAILLGALGVVTLAGVTTWGIIDKGKWDDATDQTRRDELEFRQRWINSSLFTVGMAAVGVGIYLYLSAPGMERRPAAGTAFTPVVGSDNIGFALDGTF